MRSILLVLFLFVCSISAQQESKPEYLDYKLPVEVRVNDLVSRMTLEEKISQMINSAEAIPRLSIPKYDWWNECLHGVARAGTATVFPQAIGLAATWNTDLMFRIADVISTEARAKYHEFQRNGERDIYKGLTFWSPNVNIFRDPRWGRGQETYGEDPYLTARMGVSFVKGLQGTDPNYFKVISTPKHYAVHSGPEPDRHTFDAIIDNHDLYDTYLPAFEACIKEAGAFSVMCAYNRFMGDACCGSPILLKKILRDKWGFKGYIVSDCGAIDDIFANHKVVATPPEASALAVKSGTDLECGRVYTNSLLEAVEKGLLTETEIDVSLKRLFTARFKLGMFDPDEVVKYSQIPITENDSEEHRKLSLRTAHESIVLLKNSNNILPLKKDIKKIAVIGPTADSYAMLLGNYNGFPSKYVTPLAGIKNKVASNTEVVFEQGCNVAEEGGVVNRLSSELLQTNNEEGLTAEFFKNKNLEGEPSFKKIDKLTEFDLVWGLGIPDFDWEGEYSIRWTGKILPPETGYYNFAISCGNGYRLYIDDKLLIDKWNDRNHGTENANIQLEEDKQYEFKLEYYHTASWAWLSINWHILDVDYFSKAVELAKSSDVVIFVGGITAQVEGEEMPVELDGFAGGDRTSLDLPKVQEDLLKLVYATGKPVILVLTSGSALSVNWENENIPAIVQIWYPGQEGGTALADVLFGDYNPAGRLPVTFYKSVEQLPPFEDYNMKGRTYRYFADEPLYPFGYGLSYTKFEYSNFIVPQTAATREEIKVSAEVKNVGDKEGDDVVQLYLKDKESSVTVPIHSLQGFKRVHLAPGEKQVVEFVLSPKQISVIQSGVETGDIVRVVEPGIFEISVGGIQPGTKAPTTNYVSKEIELTGENFIVK
ncbi:MAG: glycoside hydrolase family 3 C-terminal domain-containing protein [bacterium]